MRRLLGLWRLVWNCCPVCNSSPPRPDCPVCEGTRFYGPLLTMQTKAIWSRRFEGWLRAQR